jgi:hypothetical protein
MWLVFLVIALLACLWAWDRTLILSDVEQELKDWLGDLLVARDLAEPRLQVHFQAVISKLKQAIRHHFDL